jgi:TatA/E family protein of Tat protein translocase
LPQVGPLEILVILVVALIVFGPKKLPDIGRQVGRGVREFRKFQQGFRDDIEGAFGGHDDDTNDDTHDDSDEDDHSRQIEAGKSDHPPRYEPPPADTTS